MRFLAGALFGISIETPHTDVAAWALLGVWVCGAVILVRWWRNPEPDS